MAEYSLEELPHDLSDEVACDINAFENGIALELDPIYPPLPVKLTKAYAKHHDPNFLATAFAVRADNGEVAGVAWMNVDTVANQHLAFTRLAVAANHRRQGVATQLFGAYVGFAREHGRNTLLLGADFEHPAAYAFAASLGAPVAMEAHLNRLMLDEMPEGLIEHWIATAHAAGGAVEQYELQWVPDSDRPEEWLADLCVVEDVLQNDAPMGDIPINERRTTPDQLRAKSERTRAFGRDWWTLVARHTATGEPVGYTEMFFHAEDPKLGSQGATAVSAKHRGFALGRWLKATMLERVMREHPEIEYLRTFNADNNDPMLAINWAMGFKNLYASKRFMIERADAETWLEKRT